MLNTSLGFKYGSSWPRYVLFVNLHVNCCTYYDTSFRQFIKMTACYPWVVDLTAKKIPSPTEKDYLVTSVFSVVHVLFIYILLNYDTEIFSLSFYLYICPQKNYFRCKGTLTCQKCLFFFSLLLYIYTGISLNTNLINFSEVFWRNFCRIFKKLKLQIYFNIMLEDNKEFRVNYMHVYALKIIMSLHSFHSNEHKIFTI